MARRKNPSGATLLLLVVGTAAAGGVGYAVVQRRKAAAAKAKKKKKAKKKTEESQDETPSQVDKASNDGPPADPCIGVYYSQTGKYLAPELAENVSAKARDLYPDPSFFLTEAGQYVAYEQLAEHLVNYPGEPGALVSTLEALAPDCDWSAVYNDDTDKLTGSQMALYASVSKMADVVQTDLAPGVGHEKPWDVGAGIPIAEEGIIFQGGNTGLFALRLPQGAEGAYVSHLAQPQSDAHAKLGDEGANLYDVEVYGITRRKLKDEQGVYRFFPTLVLRPHLWPESRGKKAAEVVVVSVPGESEWRAFPVVIG